MSTFVLEIGSEELPARFLAGEKAALITGMTEALATANLVHGEIAAYATPRRATVVVHDLAQFETEREEVVSGPPVRIAWVDGKPSKALQGFLKTQQVSEADLMELKTPKGVYVGAKRKVGGRKAQDLLAEICPNLVQGLPFAKRMRWGSGQLAYARPIHWLLALFDSEVVSFSLDGLESDRLTYGHRIHGAGPFSVPSAPEYFSILAKQGGVVLDGDKRREIIVREGTSKAQAVGGTILWKDSLLAEVEGLVEHPVPILGSFDTGYLEVPREVLLTSMESHQKSFGVEDAQGKLLPNFLCVLNLEPQDLDVVKRGWERVLHARLEDAKFFYHEDLRANFASWLTKLDQVIFMGPLGSLGEKSRRLQALMAWLVQAVGAHDKEAAAERAGLLAKADLVSGMVGEFDTLQGIMGGIYAKVWGENPEVAQALQEQYLPAGPDSPLPESLLGALLSMADKADTLAGCFGLNKIPTGTADPNGLRRCALGIIRICVQFDFKFDLQALFAKALELYGQRPWKLSPAETCAKLNEFLAVRLQNYLQGLGHNVVLIDAILRAGLPNVPDVLTRLTTFTAFQAAPDYVENVQMLKRIGNILQKQAADIPNPPTWQAERFEDKCEQELATALAECQKQVTHDPDYSLRLKTVATLRPYVNKFFDTVMVVAPDPLVRQNRLALLQSIAQLYTAIVDVAALQI
ncbi:MAG: glycine--tRNA ligase subunit beta [Desulfovibrionaceae bacterium]|nr:glycine--tRNA ligase subunit beta [Desulfovibrionaceae bacterium]